MPSSNPSNFKRAYLLVYNAINALLWLRIFLSIVTSQSSTSIYATLEPWARWTQTLAAAEILHAATGITRAPIFTTFTQIFARSVQVWAINYGFPSVTAVSPAYPSMLLAWSIADVVRYSYFVALSAGISMPGLLKWLRYSLFIVLYPIGIGSEWWLMYKATTVTTYSLVAGIFYFCLALYAPGSVIMYSYMVKQRRKILSK